MDLARGGAAGGGGGLLSDERPGGGGQLNFSSNGQAGAGAEGEGRPSSIYRESTPRAIIMQSA